MKERVDNNRKGKYLKLEIKKYRFMPFGPIYQIDQKVIYAGFFINYDSSIRAPMVVVQNPKSEIWEIFERDFIDGWNDALDVPIN